MRHHPFKVLFTFILLTCVSLATSADDENASTSKNVLLILSAGSVQTQGMALVLGNAMADQGASITVLLCDSAGDLALRNHTSPTLKPRNISPNQMLQGLISKGAEVKVCALYLPNSGNKATDLQESITPASPAEIAEKMIHPEFKVFSF